MPNVKFNYLYRCSGNYKKFTSVIFSNPDEFDLTELEALVKSKLIWETWFYAEEWKLPEIFTDIVDFRVDPTWHEFEDIEYTKEASNTSTSLTEFIELIERTKSML